MEPEGNSCQIEDGQGKAGEDTQCEAGESGVPAISIVRGSTPMPRSFAHLLTDQEEARESVRGQGKGGRGRQDEESRQAAGPGNAAFPTKAPLAPPLPEECEEDEEDAISVVEATPLPGEKQGHDESASEFIWLFEYGLEMDSAVLNAPDKLDGSALLYGPAVLKGYRIALDAVEMPAGKPLVTLVRADSAERDAAVWGVLYRIPARLAAHRDGEASLLDRIHFAAPPASLFEAVTVVVHELYRGRDVACTTYMATVAALQQFRQKHEQEPRKSLDALFVQRFLGIARQRALPDEYVQKLSALAGASVREVKEGTVAGRVQTRPEQDTEPLPVVAEREKAPPVQKGASDDRVGKQFGAWMMTFAAYLVVLLLLVLVLAVLQGLGLASAIFTARFAPLGIPWFILVYGLLGGCVSSIVTLGRRGLTRPPAFVLITWFARPFIGSLLAMLAYLLLNSGLLVLSGGSEQRMALFSLLAALAGLMEGWVFTRKS
ncbi:MAG TPA: gamma-glutamylcyclotransferase family protein [Ktedonobacteraceae bacterium]|nr:gamma-glutamylcyclotransferase family protein [Ktedonobacteraceae bacterium]